MVNSTSAVRLEVSSGIRSRVNRNSASTVITTERCPGHAISVSPATAIQDYHIDAGGRNGSFDKQKKHGQIAPG